MIKTDLLDHGTINIDVVTDISNGLAASFFRCRSRSVGAWLNCWRNLLPPYSSPLKLQYTSNKLPGITCKQRAVLKMLFLRTIILLLVLYGCETWSLTLRKEHSLKVFDNRVLRKMYGTTMDEATREWRKLRNEELHALLSSPNIVNWSKREEWGGRGM